MSENNKNSIWPLPKFHFKVTFETSGVTFSCQEVSGLDTEEQVIEYRHGNNPIFAPIKMPGLGKFGNVILKKVMSGDQKKSLDFIRNIGSFQMTRENITITLLDEKGRPSMFWTLKNAWPSKVSGTDLKSDGNEIAIESMELAHEGLTMENI